MSVRLFSSTSFCFTCFWFFSQTSDSGTVATLFLSCVVITFSSFNPAFLPILVFVPRQFVSVIVLQSQTMQHLFFIFSSWFCFLCQESLQTLVFVSPWRAPMQQDSLHQLGMLAHIFHGTMHHHGVVLSKSLWGGGPAMPTVHSQPCGSSASSFVQLQLSHVCSNTELNHLPAVVMLLPAHHRVLRSISAHKAGRPFSFRTTRRSLCRPHS